MSGAPSDASPASTASRRAPATPARTASRSRSHRRDAEALARALLAEPEVAPAGLGARDTLRLEAGLCLYGHDIDAATTPIEAALTWAIQKVRRPGGARAGGYPGAAAIERAARRRRRAQAGRPASASSGRRCAKAPPSLDDERRGDRHASPAARSGPSVGQPIALAYVAAAHAAPGTLLHAEVRGKRLPMRVAALPFAPHRYFRG